MSEESQSCPDPIPIAGRQAPTFTNGYDALRQMLDGHSSETVALWLIEAGYWSESLSIGGAAARVRSSLRPPPGGDEFFKFSEIIFLAWKTGRPYPLYYACDELGLSRPEPRNLSAELAELMEEVPKMESELAAKRRRLQVLMDGWTGPNPETDEDGRRMRFSQGDS